MIDQEIIQTMRFFEGLGKPLSSWEVEILLQAEREASIEKGEEMKAYQIKQAVRWLKKKKAQRDGEISYCSPGMYTEPYSKKVIWDSTDEEIRAAGFDVEAARELARPPALFDHLMKPLV